MTEVSCPLDTCTYYKDKECSLNKIELLFKAAINFPSRGTVVYTECAQMELPKDREEKNDFA